MPAAFVNLLMPDDARNEGLSGVEMQDLDLPSLFASMEDARAELGVQDYSISQTTLEHVFVALAEVSTQQDKPQDPQ